MTRAGRSCARMMSPPPLHETESHEDHVHELDPRKRYEDAAHPVDPKVAPEDGRRADGTVADAAEGQRDERDDDQGVEDDGGEDSALRRGEMHDVEHAERGIRAREGRGDDGE